MSVLVVVGMGGCLVVGMTRIVESVGLFSSSEVYCSRGSSVVLFSGGERTC